MEKLFTTLNTVIKYICSVSLALMVLFIFANTVCRYFLDSSIIVTEEICRFFFVWGTFLAVITVWHEKGHIAVTTLTDLMNVKVKKWFTFCCNFMTLFAFISLIYGSYEYIMLNSYYAQITGISYAFMIIPVIISAAVCLLITIHDMGLTLTKAGE